MCTLQKKDTETKTVTETSQESFVDRPDTNWPKFKLENMVIPSNHPWITNKHITTRSLWMYLDKRFCKRGSVSLITACQTCMMLLGHKILLRAQVCEVLPRHLRNVSFHSIQFGHCLPEVGTRLQIRSPRLIPQLPYLFFWNTGYGQGFHNLCFGLLTC